MKIDKDKLADLLRTKISDFRDRPEFVAATEFAIGAAPDLQVRVIITRDQDDFEDVIPEKNLCLLEEGVER